MAVFHLWSLTKLTSLFEKKWPYYTPFHENEIGKTFKTISHSIVKCTNWSTSARAVRRKGGMRGAYALRAQTSPRRPAF